MQFNSLGHLTEWIQGQYDIISTSCASFRRPIDIGSTHMMSICCRFDVSCLFSFNYLLRFTLLYMGIIINSWLDTSYKHDWAFTTCLNFVMKRFGFLLFRFFGSDIYKRHSRNAFSISTVIVQKGYFLNTRFIYGVPCAIAGSVFF